MRTRRPFTRGAAALALAGLAGVLAACRDPGLGPERAPEPGLEASALLGGLLGGGDTAVTVFTVYPASSASYAIKGGHSVYFPAHSICDPERSSYGVTEWDEPCAAAGTAVTITAKSWKQPDGHPRVDFSPALRFVPTKTVTLSMLDPAAALDPSSGILWCPDGATACVDESADDPLLKTLINSLTGTLSRRVKHFSGYNVAASRKTY